ncbi:hypothetical protein UPYG_G00195410 [Umbra pygmaea]|uniref:Homeobox domain-containing protein n=1 Tax=Umbra pygmaea TaxID=75934 RepID=A0ABD0X4X8_UMBPY
MPHTFDYTGSYQRYGSFNCHNADLYFSASKNIIPNDERGSYPLCTNLDQLGGHQINRGRIRTVFTDTQAKGLEQLFDVTDYPCVDARAELARKVGLTEEIVRVWFKNRRARRKKKNSTKNNSPDIATSNPDWTAVYNNTIQENILTGFL